MVDLDDGVIERKSNGGLCLFQAGNLSGLKKSG